jgi:peptidoglycan/xylan/chitin deacetylase (PgdA/CDA1 family)
MSIPTRIHLGLNDPLVPLSSLLCFPIFDFPLPNYLLYRHSNSPHFDSHDEFWRVEDAMTKILGLKPKYFRPPFGKYNDQVLQVAAQRGYTKMILWSDDTQDASGECESGCMKLGLGLESWLMDIVSGGTVVGAPVWQSKQTYDNINGQSGRIVLNHNVIPGSKSVLARPGPNCLLGILSL